MKYLITSGNGKPAYSWATSKKEAVTDALYARKLGLDGIVYRIEKTGSYTPMFLTGRNIMKLNNTVIEGY